MLKLINLKKDYVVGGDVGLVHALKGLNVAFRDNEFVAILGPSGCGKTTLLNIIGGLDHASEGDLQIDEVSTKNYTDYEWDNYRNHRIGFIFQSYNLIPHQSVLQNVELALAIGGLNKEERIRKAKEALDRVGLKDEYYKKPNQLSGGQCQRVAIARALVSDPEILLADEPTGALDTETSLQIMDIIQEISKDRLVIMVTHNPDLAKQYATRIVNLLDGQIISDTNPYQEEITEKKKEDSKNKSRLSFMSAFHLSAQNLKSKSKRTALIAIAASIGIIGVSSVLAISSGVQNYIHDMEADMLSGNPIMIEESGLDLNGLMNLAGSLGQSSALIEGIEDGYVNISETISSLVDSSGNVKQFLFKNEITPEYLSYVENMHEDYYSGIVFDYGIDVSPNIFVETKLEGYPYENEGTVASLSAIRAVYQSILGETEFEDYSQYVNFLPEPFSLFPSSEELILSQYDIVSDEKTSHLPEKENEIVLVIADDSLSDLTLAETGYMSQASFLNNIYETIGDEHYDPNLEMPRISYEDLMNKSFYYYPSSSLYVKGGNPLIGGNWQYNHTKTLTEETPRLELKITAILQKKDGVNYGCLSSGFYYTEAFASLFREENASSPIVSYLKENNLEGYTTSNGIGYLYTYSFQGNQKIYGTMLSSLTQNSVMEGMINPSGTILMSLNALGGAEMPSLIEIYPKSTDQMNHIRAYLDAWNEDGDIEINGEIYPFDERTQIRYNDTLSMVLTMVNSMVELVTIALVAFTALSLVVSTVMIAVITYVSVMERVKEIGVIRSLGGRKKDVSRLFNAETLIIGFLAGALGILITYILEILLNVIVGAFTGVYTIASLPWWEALIMILLSMGLTLLSGLIPASLAAKKDPVEALRSE